MKKNKTLTALLFCAALFAVSCNEKKGGDVGGGTPVETSKIVVAATSAEATYLVLGDDFKTGNLTIIGNGKEVDNATAWIFWKEKYLYRLVYNQGNAGVTTSYMLDGAGAISERNIRHEIQSRFTTYGIYQDRIITAASGATDQKDDAGNAQYGITFTKIDVKNQTLSTQTVKSENLLGTGEYCTVSGIVESGGKIYTAVCPEGVSVYGVRNNSHLLSSEALALVNSEGGISGTVNPDKVWVAIYDNDDFSSPRIISDNRLSYATSRYRSQYYSTIASDAAGDVYVFSSSYATTQAGIQKTSLPSGVIRIKAGAEAFDESYYVNFEDPSVADRAMYKVWHIVGDYFLMQMYDQKGDDKSQKANTNRLAIFKAASKQFRWVEGLPEANVISMLSKNAYSDGRNAYIAIAQTISGSKPTIYSIDPSTAKAQAGCVITADGVSALGKLTNK